jgi:hypothetical protein
MKTMKVTPFIPLILMGRFQGKILNLRGRFEGRVLASRGRFKGKISDACFREVSNPKHQIWKLVDSSQHSENSPTGY